MAMSGLRMPLDPKVMRSSTLSMTGGSTLVYRLRRADSSCFGTTQTDDLYPSPCMPLWASMLRATCQPYAIDRSVKNIFRYSCKLNEVNCQLSGSVCRVAAVGERNSLNRATSCGLKFTWNESDWIDVQDIR